jgi:LysR family transcriptional regulator for metE and metH
MSSAAPGLRWNWTSPGFSFAPLPALERGDLDLVVTSDPVTLPGISYVPLFCYEALLAIDNHHAMRHKPYLEPADIASQTLITYPIERTRLDIFTRFLDPADVEPAQVRTSELTVMMMQLVARARRLLPAQLGRARIQFARLCNRQAPWRTRPAGKLAALRSDMLEVPTCDFLLTAKDISFTTLAGVSVPSGPVI